MEKLTETNEIMRLQMKHQEDALAKRRTEVATLHQTCTKYIQTCQDGVCSAAGSSAHTRTINSPSSSTQAENIDVSMVASYEIPKHKKPRASVEAKSFDMSVVPLLREQQEASETPPSDNSQQVEITCLSVYRFNRS